MFKVILKYHFYFRKNSLNILFCGYGIKYVKHSTELLAIFIEQDQLKQHYKNRLVGHVLNGYLSLRRLVVQRTKLIDDTQERLLQMLEELTTGSSSHLHINMITHINMIIRIIMIA